MLGSPKLHNKAKIDIMTRCGNLSNLITQAPQLPPHPDGSPAQILVLKVGTSTLMDPNKNCFSLSNLGKFVDAVCDLKDRGFHVVMVSSGAVGSGRVHMHMREQPKTMVEKQAISAIGQCRIVRLWEDIFAIRERKVAQLLLTRNDLIDRPRFVNFRNTLLQLLCMGVIPIINENDALATEGLKFGDNDTLGAYVSISIGANWFFMLTDVDCLFTANPRHHPEAKPIAYVGRVNAIYALLDESENMGTAWGSGGMRTKIIAAKLCCATGIHTALCHGEHPERILGIVEFAEMRQLRTNEHELTGHSFPVRPLGQSFVKELHKAKTRAFGEDDGGQISKPSNKATTIQLESPLDSPVSEGCPEAPDGETRADSSSDSGEKRDKLAFVTFPSVNDMPYLGTIFAGQPCTQSLRDQRRWILSLPVRGAIYLDENCSRAIIEKRKSLFAAGIVHIQDEFFPGEAVALYAANADNSIPDCRENHSELARCLVNFSSIELERIKGRKTSEFQNILGYYCAHEVAHRSNIIFVNPAPVYERYSIKITKDMVHESDDEGDDTGIALPRYSPVPVPAGETHSDAWAP